MADDDYFIADDNYFMADDDCFMADDDCFMGDDDCFMADDDCFMADDDCFMADDDCFMANDDCFMADDDCFMADDDYTIHCKSIIVNQIINVSHKTIIVSLSSVSKRSARSVLCQRSDLLSPMFILKIHGHFSNLRNFINEPI
jgi:hypothetical protein